MKLLVLIFALSSAAQTPDRATLLDRAAEQAAKLADSLPSFTCERDGTSDIVPPSNAFDLHSAFTGTVRVTRSPDSSVLQESILYTTVNGPVVSDIQNSFSYPLFYFSRSVRECFSYQVTTGWGRAARVTFVSTSVPDLACSQLGWTKGFALVDPDGHITHLERTVEEPYAKSWSIVPSIKIDMAPVVLDGQTFWLAKHVVASQPKGNATLHLKVHYTHCQLFKANVTVLPEVKVVPENKP